jgi:predicted lipoprotein with Yx(FWY)xxD motif
VTRHRTFLVAGAFAAAVALAIVLTRSSPSSHVGAGGEGRPVRKAPDVRVRAGPLGRILVNRHGRTMYLFLKDRHGHSTCTGPCARVWPPVIVSGRPRAGAGVDQGQVTTTTRMNHGRQLVYHGHPLYTMNADTRPGQMAGQGFLGTWFVVSSSGDRIGKATARAEGY